MQEKGAERTMQEKGAERTMQGERREQCRRKETCAGVYVSVRVCVCV